VPATAHATMRRENRSATSSTATRSRKPRHAGAPLCNSRRVNRVRLLPAAGSPRSLLLFLALFVLFCVGCTSVPAGRSAVESVEFTNNDAIDADDLREKIATADSPKFLGVFQGVVYDWNVFDRFVLERDLQRIERYYRARGYYHARVRAGRVFFVSNNKVRVDIIIEEGEQMLVARVDLHGLEGLPTPVIADVSQQVLRKLKIDKPSKKQSSTKRPRSCKRR